MLFSVIIPVYNVKDYLVRCVQSVENQISEYKYEIILVDDGSTDGSSFLCDLIEQRNSSVKVIHKMNGGLSEARNTGLKRAKGDYIIFLDSDDYLSQNAIEIIGQEICRYTPDILFANAVIVKNKKKITLAKTGIDENKVYKGCSAMIAELQSGKYQAMAQLGIYKRNYLLINNYYFKNGILHEDEEWSPRVMANADSIVYKNFGFYMYEIREGSITQKKDKTRNASDLIDTCYCLENEFANYSNEMLRKLYFSYLARLYMAAVSECIMRGDISEIRKKIKRTFVWGKWENSRDFLKIVLFCVSSKVYAKQLEKARENTII